jgi:WD40 repeat protein
MAYATCVVKPVTGTEYNADACLRLTFAAQEFFPFCYNHVSVVDLRICFVRDSLPSLVFLTGIAFITALILPFAPRSPTRELISAYTVYRLGTLARLTGHTQDVSSAVFSPDQRWLASGSVDGSARLWNVASTLTSGYQNPDNGTFSRHIQASQSMITSVAFSADSESLAAASADGMVSLWDVETGRQLNAISAHDGLVSNVIFSPDGTRIASAGYDHAVRLWDAETGEQAAELTGHTGPVLLVRYIPDGRLIASASLDGTIRLWDAATLTLLASLDAPAVQGMNFSADGSLLGAVSRVPVGVSQDGEPLWGVHIWRISAENLSEVRKFPVLKSPVGPIYDLVFSQDEDMLILAEADASLRFLDVSTGREIAQRWDHSDQIVALTLSADGTLLASASLDDTLKLWKIMPQ